MRIKRFYKDTRYMGIRYQNRDTFGDWREEINLKSWYGRPYSPSHYDEIYEFSVDLWEQFVAKADRQARATNREVVRGEDYLYLVPIWIHGEIKKV